MAEPKITWFIKEPDDNYVAHTDYYAGYCNSSDDFIVDIEIWNNRWNTNESVDDIENAKLVITFADANDAILLKLCEIKLGDESYVKIDDSEFNRGVFDIGNISGQSNNGSYAYIDNYKKVSIKFNGIPGNTDSLKSMFLDIQY